MSQEENGQNFNSCSGYNYYLNFNAAGKHRVTIPTPGDLSVEIRGNASHEFSYSKNLQATVIPVTPKKELTPSSSTSQGSHSSGDNVFYTPKGQAVQGTAPAFGTPVPMPGSPFRSPHQH